MQTYNFEIHQNQLDALLKFFPNTGKNWDVGSIAVKIVELYFKNKHPECIILRGTKGADLELQNEGITERYEIKGTTDHGIAWSKLKVSSQDCYECLIRGMTLIRVTSIGSLKMQLHFMKYGEDFTLHTEVRYAVKPVKKTRNTR